jgi:hypothetical protein
MRSFVRARSGPGRLSPLLAALALGSLAATALPFGPTASAEPVDAPSLHLFASESVVQLHRHRGEPVFAEVPMYVTPVGGTFDLRVQRPDYASPFGVRQVVHAADGSTTDKAHTFEVRSLRGLRKFFQLTVTDPDGEVVQQRNRAFCPNSWGQQRIDPDGADRSTFPDGCYGMRFAMGSTWGIDSGWASPALGERGLVLDGRNGRYTVTVSIQEPYRTAFGIADEDATATTVFRVRKGTGAHHHERRTGALKRPTEAAPGRAPQTKLMLDPPAANLPDLRSLPAFGMDVDRRGKRDWLSFGANIWVAGNSLLDIEGFRRKGEPVMDAYQYFYDGQEVVGKAPVGTLEFDLRDGHHHWHLQQFAAYRLLSADQTHVAKSRKQSFCIVPTDPIDLSLDGAERRPYATGLDSACGASNALWIRETLPVGWGDTYFQYKAGQSFNITNLPNGRYYIAVDANPTGELFESDTTNNTTLREIRLKGKPGKRKVCVPAYFGIGQEGTC